LTVSIVDVKPQCLIPSPKHVQVKADHIVHGLNANLWDDAARRRKLSGMLPIRIIWRVCQGLDLSSSVLVL
jgi:hypothetical protein